MLDKTIELIALEMEANYSEKAIKEFIRSVYGVEYNPAENSMRKGRKPLPEPQPQLRST